MKTEEEIVSQAAEREHCLNCEAKLQGNFCQFCGQPATAARYTFKTFLTEFYHSFSSVIFGNVIRTFWAMVVRPGDFLREYLGGKRVGFTLPIKYFFYAFVLELAVRGLLIWLTHNQHFAIEGKYDLRYQIVELTSTFFWGSLWWLFYRKSGLTFVENSICALYFVAQMNFYSVIFLVLSAPLIGHEYFYDAFSVVEMVLEIGYAFYFARMLFGDPYWKLVPKQIVLTIFFVILSLIFYLLDQWLRSAFPLSS